MSNDKGNSTCPPLIKASGRQLPGFTSTDGQDVWRGEFTFVQAADTQLGLLERYIEEKPWPRSWQRELAWSEAMVREVNQLQPRPAFIVICGDLVDAMPGDQDRAAQTRDMMKALSGLSPDIPLVCVCGNHDVGDKPTPSSIADYTGTWGEDYFSFWLGGVKFIVINSQLLYESTDCPEQARQQEAWLNAQLDAEENKRAKHLIVFQHIPWFTTNVDDPENYFNLPLAARAHFLPRLYSAGVRHVFAGHLHKNTGGRYFPPGQQDGKGVEVVVTSAVGVQLGADDHGFRLVRVTDTCVEHEYKTLAR